MDCPVRLIGCRRDTAGRQNRTRRRAGAKTAGSSTHSAIGVGAVLPHPRARDHFTMTLLLRNRSEGGPTRARVVIVALFLLPALASAVSFHAIASVSSSTGGSDFWPVSNLIEGGTVLGAQVVATVISWVLAIVATFIILKVLDATMGLRVSRDEEIQGLDLSEHGEEGYILI